MARVVERQISSFWRNFHQWLHRKLPFWQIPFRNFRCRQWRHFRQNDDMCFSISILFPFQGDTEWPTRCVVGDEFEPHGRGHVVAGCDHRGLVDGNPHVGYIWGDECAATESLRSCVADRDGGDCGYNNGGRVMVTFYQLIEAEWRIYASVNLTIICSDNGMSPDRRLVIIWTSAGILLFGPLGTKFSEIVSEIHLFSVTKIHLKMAAIFSRP